MTQADLRARGRHARVMLRNGSAPLWRNVFNRSALRQHRAAPPDLGPTAQRALVDLRRDGIAITSLEALTGDPTLLGQLQELAKEIEERHLLAVEAGTTQVAAKEFLVQLLGRRPFVDPEGLLAQTALHPQLKGLADSYFGLHSRLSDLNVWRTPVLAADASASQLWHRDIRDDHVIVKAFLYLEPVDEGAGPFCFLKGSHTSGPLRRLDVRTSRDRWSWRASDEDMERAAPRDAWLSCTGPAGTLVLADTNGYHKGGLARTAPRLLVHARYSSATALNRVPLRLAPGHDAETWKREIAFQD